MKIDAYIKENKGRSFDLPFSIKQDSTIIEEITKVLSVNNNKRHVHSKGYHSENNTLPINFKEELP